MHGYMGYRDNGKDNGNYYLLRRNIEVAGSLLGAEAA